MLRIRRIVIRREHKGWDDYFFPHPLFPDMNLDQVLAKLLLERAQKNLIKYRTLARRFEVKYGQNFETFRQMVLRSKPIFEVEQDYFDWEMSVTGMADMEEEIHRLKRLVQPS